MLAAINQRVNLLENVDFGEIDGDGDPNLERYFLDNQYWDKIICGNIFYVIGKKGTGKSSIYRMIAEQAIKKGDIIQNKDFGDFPFEKLLSLSDDNFSMPNQYQSIWKNLILNIFASMINKVPETQNSCYNEIATYVKSCMGNDNDVVELHKDIVNYTYKTSLGLNFKGIGISGDSGKSVVIGSGANNVSKINSALLDLIINYFMASNHNTKFIIQFDRLDDNYNQYQNTEQYYQSIISLFKVAYQINQKFRSKNINNAKVVLYLRSDIYRELADRDAESARWDNFMFRINWAIKNKDDWENSKLLQMINKRISTSFDNPNDIVSFYDIFDNTEIDLQKANGEREDVFKYIIEKTMHRPRDVVQFCKCIQNEVRNTKQLYFRTIKNAEKEYADWLINRELANEINPVLKSIEPIYDLLKLLGSKPFSMTDFFDRYRSVKGIGMEREKLVYYLYDVGIIQNISFSPYRLRSAIRNEGKLDRNMKIIIHSGVWTGLNV